MPRHTFFIVDVFTAILSNHERNGGYDVRIFTPAAQVPFAGHRTAPDIRQWEHREL
jgi:predicted PhzF superfamily epimerase YddE/YHI9